MPVQVALYQKKLRPGRQWYGECMRLYPHPLGGFALAEAFDFFGNAHLTEYVFYHDPADVRAFLFDIRNAEFAELPVDGRFDNAGLGSIKAQRISNQSHSPGYFSLFSMQHISAVSISQW